LMPWVLAFSGGVQASVSSVVPPTNRKHQPTPTSTIDDQNAVTVVLEIAMTMAPSLSNTPQNMTGSVPMRVISQPVPKAGANMAMMCHSITSIAAPYGWEHIFMASGVAAINRFITPYAVIPPSAATMNTG